MQSVNVTEMGISECFYYGKPCRVSEMSVRVCFYCGKSGKVNEIMSVCYLSKRKVKCVSFTMQ